MQDQSKDHDKYFSSKQDTYIDQATGVLKNIPNLQNPKELEKFEEVIFQAHFVEATDYISTTEAIGLTEWQHIHKTCFEDVYTWAGKLRTIRIAKGRTIFAYPEAIESEANRLFDEINIKLREKSLSFEDAAKYFADINVLHPFREGNGRTQRILFSEIFNRLDVTIDYTLTSQEEMIAAMVDGYKGNYESVAKLFKNITH